MTLPASLKANGVPAEYRALHKYLADRFADTVVLTFAQVEDLLGFPLPEGARLRLTWWVADDDGGASAHSRAWNDAGRTATPNLRAQTVAFERALN